MFEFKDGQFNLYVNKSKEESFEKGWTVKEWPDLSGKGLDLDGVEVRISCWWSTKKNGDKFLKCSTKDIEK